MNFEYDIFISYGEPESESNQMDLWASRFCEYLSIVLERLNDRKLTFMLHEDLRARKKLLGNDVSQVFSRTALFVAIISPEYIKSETYPNEIEEIYKTIYKDTSDSSRKTNRIFKVMTTPLPNEQQPDCFVDELSYNFFEINRFSKKARTFEISDETGPEEKFLFKLVDLAYDIQTSLNIIHSENRKEFDKYIYLAETTIDQQENRDEIKRELQHLGIGILPLINLPNDSEKLELSINSYLSRSMLSIHIMGAYYGDLVKNSKFSLIDFQNRIAKSFLEKEPVNSFKRLIWIPNDNKYSEQRQSLYLNRLKRDDADENTEIIEAPIELFKSVLQSRISEKEKISTQSNGKFKIYLIYENQETPELIEFKNLCTEKGLNIIEYNPKEQQYGAVTKHKLNMIQADAVLIYKGNSSINWLNTKVQDLAKAPGFGRQKPFAIVGVVSADGYNKDIVKFLNDTEIVSSISLNKNFADEFLKKLIEYQNVR